MYSTAHARFTHSICYPIYTKEAVKTPTDGGHNNGYKFFLLFIYLFYYYHRQQDTYILDS